jgi:hypothetical protein
MRKMLSVEEVIFQNKVRQENIILKLKIKELERKIEYLNTHIVDKCGYSSDVLKKRLKNVGL